jgi:hypothetical protein
MKQLSNLPPGCRESDLPGNSPEDDRYEDWLERVNDALAAVGVDWGKLNTEQFLLVHEWACDYYTDNPPERDEDGWHDPSPRAAAEIVRERLAEPMEDRCPSR